MFNSGRVCLTRAWVTRYLALEFGLRSFCHSVITSFYYGMTENMHKHEFNLLYTGHLS